MNGSGGFVAMKDWGGSKRTLGKSERAVAISPEVQAAAKATQPTGSDHMKRRRETPDGSPFPAASAAGATAACGAAPDEAEASLPSDMRPSPAWSFSLSVETQ